MRYSHPLHTSRKKNVLKNKRKTSLISLAWFAAIFAVLMLLVNVTKLDPGAMFGGFFVSLARVTVAYVVSLILAVGVSLLITSNETLENATLPVFDVLQSFPSFALFPALVVAIKSSEVIIISVLIIALIWPIMFSVIAGIKNRREDLEEAATIFGAIGFKRLVYFTLPQLAPTIVTGSIVGWGNAWELIIGAELLVNAKIGIGSYLGVLGNSQQNLLLAFGIVVLMLLLFVINKLIWLPLLSSTTRYQSE